MCGEVKEEKNTCAWMNEWNSLSCVRLFATPWIIARQVSLSLEFSWQEYWSGLPFPSPGDLPNPGIEPRSPVLQVDSLLTELWGKPQKCILYQFSPFSVWPSHNGSTSALPFQLKTVLTQGFCTRCSLCLELHAFTYAHGLHLSFHSSLCSKACISERSSIMDWIEYPPKFICWSHSPQWVYLKTGSFREVTKVKWGCKGETLIQSL